MNKGPPVFIINLQECHLLHKSIVNKRGAPRSYLHNKSAHLLPTHNCPARNQKPVSQCFKHSRHGCKMANKECLGNKCKKTFQNHLCRVLLCQALCPNIPTMCSPIAMTWSRIFQNSCIILRNPFLLFSKGKTCIFPSQTFNNRYS